MSIFLGKNNGNPLCHITSGVNTLAELKGSPRSNTIFHSDLQYIEYKLYTCTFQKGNVFFREEGYRMIDYTYFLYQRCYLGSASLYSIPSEALTAISNGQAFIILVNGVARGTFAPKGQPLYYTNGNGVRSKSVPYTMAFNYFFDTTAGTLVNNIWWIEDSHWSWYPTSTFKYLALMNVSAGDAVEIVVANFSINGFVNPTNFSGSITLNSSTLQFGSTRLEQLKHLSFTTINSIDRVIDLGGFSGYSPQLIGSISSTGITSIVSNPNYIKLMVNGKYLVDSTKGSFGVGIKTPKQHFYYSGTTINKYQNIFPEIKICDAFSGSVLVGVNNIHKNGFIVDTSKTTKSIGVVFHNKPYISWANYYYTLVHIIYYRNNAFYLAYDILNFGESAFTANNMTTSATDIDYILIAPS